MTLKRYRVLDYTQKEMDGAGVEVLIIVVAISVVGLAVGVCMCRRHRNRYAIRPVSLLREEGI